MAAVLQKDVIDLPKTDDGVALIVIETPRGSGNKLTYDPELGAFKLDRVLPAGMTFPFDFGFLPQTIADDGDPLDVIVLLDSPAYPGCVVPSRLVGEPRSRAARSRLRGMEAERPAARRRRRIARSRLGPDHPRHRPVHHRIDRRVLCRLPPARRRRVPGHGRRRRPCRRTSGPRRQRDISRAGGTGGAGIQRSMTRSAERDDDEIAVGTTTALGRPSFVAGAGRGRGIRKVH